MMDHFDTHAGQISIRGFDWWKMVQTFAAEGVTDGHGNAPSLDTVKATFFRVHRGRTGRKTKQRSARLKQEISRTFQRSAA